MALIPAATIGVTPHQQLLGHTPGILARWSALEDTLYTETLEPALLEQVRRALAMEIGCRYCIARGGPPALEAASSRTQRAAAYAVRVARRETLGSPTLLAMLGPDFTVREISALTAFVCFTMAAQVLGAALGLEADASCAMSPVAADCGV